MRKHINKAIVSAVLITSIIISSTSNLFYSVHAKTGSDTDSDIEISTETVTGSEVDDNTDIQIESSGVNDDIVISDDVSDDGIDISDADINITEDNDDDANVGTNSNNDNVDGVANVVTNNNNNNIAKATDLFTASVLRDNNKTLDTGADTVLHVKVDNKSDNKAVFKVYFTAVSNLSSDKSDWDAYLMKPALNLQIKGLDDECKMAVDMTDKNGLTDTGSLEFLKEVKDDKVVARYVSITLPAGVRTSFDLNVVSLEDGIVTVIPVIEQDEVASYGDTVTIKWKNKATFLEKIMSLFADNKKSKTDDIDVSDLQGNKFIQNDEVDMSEQSGFIETDVESVNDSDDVILDAANENYVKEHLDEKYAKLETFELANVLHVKQTIVDGSLITDKDNIDTIMNGNATGQILIGMFNAAVAMYNTDDDSDYFVGFANTMLNDDDYYVQDAVFAVTNNNGEVLDGCIYDKATGLTYIPKKYYFTGDDTIKFLDVQLQLLQVLKPNETEYVSSYTLISDTENEQAVVEDNPFRVESKVQTTAGLDESRLVVVANGLPLSERSYDYDADTGILNISEPTAVLSNVIVSEIEDDETLSSIKGDISVSEMNTLASYGLSKSSGSLRSTIYGVNKVASYGLNRVNGYIKKSARLSNYDGMEYHGDCTVTLTNIGTGGYIEGQGYLKYGSANVVSPDPVGMPWNHCYGIVSDSDALWFNDLIYNGTKTIDFSKISEATVEMNYHLIIRDASHGIQSTFADTNRSISFSDANNYIVLQCVHIAKSILEPPLGEDEMITDNPKSARVGVRVMYISPDKSYVVLGFVTPYSHTQTGYGLIKFKLYQPPTEEKGNFTVTKVWSDNNNQYGVRPSSVTVTLYRDNNVFNSQTLSASNNWSYTWNNLVTKESNGTTHDYKIVENTVPGYTLSYNYNHPRGGGGFKKGTGSTWSSTITNKIQIEYGDITVEKVWDDYDNEFSTRPNSVYVSVYRKAQSATSWTHVASTVLNAANNWSYTWSNLPIKYGNNGLYNYKVVENGISGYRIKYKLSNDNGGGFQQVETTDGSLKYKAEIKNIINVGFLRVLKESALPDITDNNKCYSLLGAKYGVYKDRSCTNKVGEVTTDITGKSDVIELVPGTYYIKEMSASMGYELDTNVYEAEVTVDNTAVVPLEVTVPEQPGNDPVGIEITKIWNGAKTPTIPTLEGTQFTMCYYDGYYNTADEVTTLTPKRTWVIEAKKNAATGRYIAGLSDTYLVADVSDELYRNTLGGPVIPYGTITIQETKPAAGYTLNGEFRDKKGNTILPNEIYISQVKKENGIVALQGGNVYESADDPKPIRIEIFKHDSDDNPLENVVFEIKDSDGNEVVDMSGNVVGPVSTDTDGKAVFDNLYPNVYVITEVKTVDGLQLLKEPITVYAPMRVTEQEIRDNNIDRTKCVYDEADDIYYIFNLTYDVNNTATFEMPMAGGTFDNRLLIPLGAGMILLGCAFTLVFRKKKRA